MDVESQDSVPRWAIEDYEGAEKDFSDWLYQVIYAHWTGGSDDKIVAARKAAEARARTLERTEEIQVLAQRAALYQAWKAQMEGWYHFLPGEYDSLAEFMDSIVDDDTMSAAVRSDVIYLATTVLPIYSKLNYPPEKIAGISSNFSKARTAVPYIRRAIKTQKGEQLSETLGSILEGIVDPKVSWRKFLDSLPKYHIDAGIEPVWGDLYIFAPYNMIVIRTTDSDSIVKFLERRTRGVVQFRGAKSPTELLEELSDMLIAKEDDG